jgi:hypothetical protein
MDLVHQQIKPEKGFKEVTESSKGKTAAREDTVLEQGKFGRIWNTVQLMIEQHLYSTTTYHLPLTESRLSENMIKDPLSEFFLNKRIRIYAQGL